MEKFEKKVNELNAVVDILQATTEYYEALEEANAEDLLKLNKIVYFEMRELVDDLIGMIIQLKKEEK